MIILLLVSVLAGAAQVFGSEAEIHNTKNATKISCQSPFHEVGSHCLFIDNLISGTLADMKDVCLDLDGHLVGLQDANLLADIVEYIVDKGLDDVSYWTNGNDRDNEGVWVWQHDHSQVHMGTPVWGEATSAGKEPQGGVQENCAGLYMEDKYFLQDFDCDAAFSLICEQDAAREDVKESFTRTSSAGCSEPFEDIGGRCLFVNTHSNGTWQEQRRFCELLNARMIKLDDANVLAAIYDYLLANGHTSEHIFIGASDVDVEGEWRWLDGSPVRMGTPFWGNSVMGAQEPLGGEEQNCLILAKNDYFYFHDYGCDMLTGVICEV